MGSLSTFSAEQWEALVDAAPSIAAAVAVVSGSRSQTKQELNAFLQKLARDRGVATGLLAELVRRVDERSKASGFEPDWDVALPHGLQAARRAGALLSTVAEADVAEADAVRRWLRTVAESVAAAAREGGVLGVGAQRISDRERETMAQIQDALGAAVED